MIKEERGFYWIRRQMRNKAVHHKQQYISQPLLNLAAHLSCATQGVFISFFLSFFFTPFTSITLSPSVFFFSLPHDSVDTYIHLSPSEKKTSSFFPCCVVSDSFLSPSCVLCLLSHQWNIEESTEHVSNPHVCCWVVLQGRLFSPLQFGGAVCSCVWIMSRACLCVCVCLFVCKSCL